MSCTRLCVVLSLLTGAALPSLSAEPARRILVLTGRVGESGAATTSDDVAAVMSRFIPYFNTQSERINFTSYVLAGPYVLDASVWGEPNACVNTDGPNGWPARLEEFARAEGIEIADYDLTLFNTAFRPNTVSSADQYPGMLCDVFLASGSNSRVYLSSRMATESMSSLMGLLAHETGHALHYPFMIHLPYPNFGLSEMQAATYASANCQQGPIDRPFDLWTFDPWVACPGLSTHDGGRADFSDPMGSVRFVNFNAVHKYQLGGLDGANDVVTIASPSDVPVGRVLTVAPLATGVGSPAGPQVVRIDGRPDGGVLFLSFRRQEGWDQELQDVSSDGMRSDFLQGVSVHHFRLDQQTSALPVLLLEVLEDGEYLGVGDGIFLRQTGHGEAGAVLEVVDRVGLADVSGPGRIDGLDLARLGRSFGTRSSDAGFDPWVDLDGDGTVDGDDLVALASVFGRSRPVALAPTSGARADRRAATSASRTLPIASSTRRGTP